MDALFDIVMAASLIGSLVTTWLALFSFGMSFVLEETMAKKLREVSIASALVSISLKLTLLHNHLTVLIP